MNSSQPQTLVDSIPQSEMEQPDEVQPQPTEVDSIPQSEMGQPDEVQPQPTEQTELQRGDIRQGTILSVDEKGALVDLGLEQLGVVPARDLRKLNATRRDALQSGEPVSVYVVDPKDENGKVVLSIYQAALNKKWLEAEQLKESGKIWEGKVVGYNQGGVIVPFGRLHGFVPISHLMDMPRRGNVGQIRERLGNYIGRKLPLRVIEVDRRRRRLVLSYRKAYPIWREQQRQAFIDNLTEGDVLTGRVRELCDFGAFVDLGSGDGLIHISELAWHRVSHPKEVLRVGQEIQVYLLKVNRKRKRIALSLKRLTPHPWLSVGERYQVHQLVEGLLTRVVSYGAFVELEPGIEGLLHVRHLPGGPAQDPHKVVTEGELHLLRVVSIDSKRRRLRLSLRAVTPEEQLDWMAHRAEAEERAIVGLAELSGEEE